MSLTQASGSAITIMQETIRDSLFGQKWLIGCLTPIEAEGYHSNFVCPNFYGLTYFTYYSWSNPITQMPDASTIISDPRILSE